MFVGVNLEDLRKFCLSFPGATEDIKWGNDLCFSVGGKMFCVTGVDSLEYGISLKATPERFADLTERDGIIPAQYVARYHWVTIERSDAVRATELKSLIEASYDLVFDKLTAKTKRTIGAASS